MEASGGSALAIAVVATGLICTACSGQSQPPRESAKLGAAAATSAPPPASTAPSGTVEVQLDPYSKNLAMYHGHLGASLTLDENCKLMTDHERKVIKAQWDQTMVWLGEIKDWKQRATISGVSIQFENDLIGNTACGPNARKVIDEALLNANRMNAAGRR